MSNQEPKRFNIDSFERLLNVLTLDNLQCLSIDIVEWMAMYISLIEKTRKENPESTEGKSNWELIQATFVYIDDGESGIKYTQLTNKSTGEITIIEVKKS
jgi:hypothetical protein